MYENETRLRIHWLLLAFYGEGTMDVSAVHRVRKWRDNAGYLDLERPGTTVWQACQHNSETYDHNLRFEQAKSRQTY